ncbi:MAG TPA: hypothetical protein VKD72_28575, partial [Gemmataceae bacterium]|nr:hypothetical protein [Gemmataceae bacterium]
SLAASADEDTTPAADESHEEAIVRAPEAPRGDGVHEVRVGCIGRGHAGKTALFHALGESLVGDFLPSGLHVDAGDPREVAQMIREAEEAQRLLHQFGLPPTLKAAQIRYCLYDGAEPRIVYRMREVIGQVITHTLPDSAADQQARYTDYVRSLVDTHVLWAVIPCQPSDPSAVDRRRYANDLRITLAYLREALRLRALEQPVAVALVLSKIDALFQNAEEARASLTDEVLRACFGPLVHLIEQSNQIADAAIIPVTSFGFGNAVLREEGSTREGSHPEAEEEPFGSEPIWLLREDASAQRYNLDTLFTWTLFYGLLNSVGNGVINEDTELGQICRTVSEDLAALNHWLLPLKDGSQIRPESGVRS